MIAFERSRFAGVGCLLDQAARSLFQWSRQRGVLAVTLLAVALAVLSCKPPRRPGHYWQLGWGGYAMGHAQEKLEGIRWDWVVLGLGSLSLDDAINAANEALQHNPRQRYLVRLWPVNGLGKFPQHGMQGSFLDYHFDPEVRETIRERIRHDVHAVLTRIKQPQNVIGFTFLEELPGHWANGILKPDDFYLRHFGPQIAKEMGSKKFEWNEAAKKHLCRLYVATLREIYAHMRSLAPGKMIFHWQRTGTPTLDRYWSATPHWQDASLHRLSDVIGRGAADGLFTYPNRQDLWDQYLALARKHRWPFFSQLSHPSRMRGSPWSDVQRMAQTPDPLNWGTFFYCDGRCEGVDRFNDPLIPKGRNRGAIDQQVHIRRFQNQHKVGLSALFSYLRPRLFVDAPLALLQEKGQATLTIFVRNPRDIEYWPSYLKDKQALHGIRVRLEGPTGLSFVATKPFDSAPLAPGAFRRYEFALRTKKVVLPLSTPLRISVTSSTSPAAEVTITGDTPIPLGRPHEISPGERSWVESGLRLPRPMKATVIMTPISEQVVNPSVSIGRHTLRYEGAVKVGQRLTIAGGKATLRVANVLGRWVGTLAGKGANGIRAFDSGYVVWARQPMVPLERGRHYVLDAEGKADGGGNSGVGLRFRGQFERGYHVDKQHKFVMVLTNKFSKTWSSVSHTIMPPKGATHLESIYLYRLGNRGRVSYRSLSLRPVEPDADVTARLRGEVPILEPGKLNRVSYRDQNGDRMSKKVEVTVMVDPSQSNP